MLNVREVYLVVIPFVLPYVTTFLKEIIHIFFKIFFKIIIIIFGFEYITMKSRHCANTTKKLCKIIDESYIYSTNYIYSINKKKIPYGIIIGKNYIVYKEILYEFDELSPSSKKYELHMITKKKIIEEIDNIVDNINDNNDNNVEKIEKNNKIKYLRKTDAYLNSEYTTLTKTLYGNISENQNNIIKLIKKYLLLSEKNKYPFGGIFFISGQKGVGKSHISKFLTKELDGTLCDTFYPNCFGDVYEDLYNKILPTRDNPLILVINEIDNIFESFKYKKEHRFYRRNVEDKDSWNNFMDYISEENNVVMILTSNLTMEQINNKYDSSLLRYGRVHLSINMYIDKYEINDIINENIYDNNRFT